MIARLIGFAALTLVTILGNLIIVIAICVEPRLKSVRIPFCFDHLLVLMAIFLLSLF